MHGLEKWLEALFPNGRMKRFSMLLCLLFAAPVHGQNNELRVGAAAVSITPPAGTPLAGYYRKRLSEGVLDDLYSKAVVVERDGVKAAIGYIPNKSAYPEGNYEVVSARCAAGSGEMLVTAALNLLHEARTSLFAR
jgi:hypothetical protein